MATLTVPKPGTEVAGTASVIKTPPYSEAVQVYVWRNRQVMGLYPDQHHPGHASMQVFEKGKKGVYVSWWPQKGGFGKGALIQKGFKNRRLSLDAVLELGKQTRPALEQEWKIRQQLMDRPKGLAPIEFRKGQYRHEAEDDFDIDTAEENEGLLWMQLPSDSISLPGMGAQGVYWGLYLPGITKWWSDWSTKEQYEMWSTTNNCAGAVSLALKHAGAWCYLKEPGHAWNVITPSQIAAYATELSRRMRELDMHSARLNRRLISETEWQKCSLAGPFPKPDDWKKATYLKGKPRSGKLSKIDAALAGLTSFETLEFDLEKHKRLVALVEAVHEHVVERPQSERRNWVLKLADMALKFLRAQSQWVSNSAV